MGITEEFPKSESGLPEFGVIFSVANWDVFVQKFTGFLEKVRILKASPETLNEVIGEAEKMMEEANEAGHAINPDADISFGPIPEAIETARAGNYEKAAELIESSKYWVDGFNSALSADPSPSFMETFSEAKTLAQSGDAAAAAENFGMWSSGASDALSFIPPLPIG